MNPLIMEIPIKIIRAQELVIGTLAWDEAKKVTGLNLDQINKSVSINGNTYDIIDALVGQYGRLFGRASREVCKEAVQDILEKLLPQEIPNSLK